MRLKILPLTLSIGLCLAIGFLGSFFTISSVSTWYLTLNKPPFSPPNFIFGPVWTVLYILMGISLYLVWVKGIKRKAIKTAVSFFILQLFLNFLWSILFFGLHSPVLAMINIILLWIAIVITMTKFQAISRLSMILLIPYILWVSFAAILNFSIIILNR